MLYQTSELTLGKNGDMQIWGEKVWGWVLFFPLLWKQYGKREEQIFSHASLSAVAFKLWLEQQMNKVFCIYNRGNNTSCYIIFPRKWYSRAEASSHAITVGRCRSKIASFLRRGKKKKITGKGKVTALVFKHFSVA